MKKVVNICLVLLAFAGLSACSSGMTTVMKFAPDTDPPMDVTRLPSLYVTSLNVTVPRTLSVSEGTGYLPSADIVWRGENYGDRYAQIQAIFEDGFGKSTDEIKGNLPIVVNVEVLRFHALTERTRYSVGGVHSISFNLEVLNAETDDIIVPEYPVHANLRGYGGSEALAADRVGLTQRVRIVEHLSNVIQSQLTGNAYIPPK